jgi:glycosyltransferase involved in cell wall biosynthesis
MKILHTVHRYAPYIGGSEEVVQQLSERLVSYGHDVTVATTPSSERTSCVINGVNIVEFDCQGDIVQGIKGEVQAYQSFLLKNDFDIMMNYGAQVWCTDLVFELLPRLKMRKILVPIGFYRLHDRRYEMYFQKLPAVLSHYDHVIYLSPNGPDKKFTDAFGLTNGIVIPNAVDIELFSRVSRGSFRQRYGCQDEFIIINVSNHSVVKNHSLFWKCARLLKKKGFEVFHIGTPLKRGIKKWLRECYSTCVMNSVRTGVPLLENLSRREVIEAFVDADVVLFTSSFEASPLVMFEAFASKSLFVTTDCGNVRDYEDVVCLINNEQEGVEIISEYRAHPENFASRIEKGYHYVHERLNWDSISREYENLYRSFFNPTT